MRCTTVKQGTECTFMTTDGCSFGAPSGACETVVPQCEGIGVEADSACPNIKEFPTGKYCSAYASPAAKWQFGICPMGRHVKVKETEKKKINPLKASKKAAAGR